MIAGAGLSLVGAFTLLSMGVALSAAIATGAIIFILPFAVMVGVCYN